MEVVGELRMHSESEERPGHSTIEWRIPSFVFLSVKKCDGYKSDSFGFAGERWYLYIFRGQYFELYICKEASPRECSVHFEASYKRSDGTLESMGKWTKAFLKGEDDGSYGFYNGNILTFSDEHETIVFSFLTPGQHRVSLLKRAVDIASDSKPINESSQVVEASTQTESDNCTDKLSNDLSQLLLDGEDSDLTIRVKGVEFFLHRNIMRVRTPVFSAMLSHDMKEKATGVVCIEDCEPEVFQAFVRYLYTGMVNELSTDTVFELFALADKYRVDELKSACLEFIRRSVSVDTFCDFLNLALTYEQGELLRQATDFFGRNMKAILQTVKWMNYLTEHPIEANELILKAVEIISK